MCKLNKKGGDYQMILGIKRYTSPSYLVGKSLAYATKFIISNIKNKGEMKNVQQQRKQK